LQAGAVHGVVVLSLLLDLASMEEAVRAGSGVPAASSSYPKELFFGGLSMARSVIPPDLMAISSRCFGSIRRCSPALCTWFVPTGAVAG
jgi:hypothetical protein